MIKASTLYLLCLTLFPLISLEFLPISLVFIFVALLLIRIKKSFPQWLIYIISISTVFYIRELFGTLIIPESTISFLATMCLARILAKDNTDYRINRILGFLWGGCFILFRTDLLAIITLSITTLLLLKTITFKDDDVIDLKDLFLIKNVKFKDILMGIALVTVLFIFFPRIYNFLPTVRSQPVGKIGYSKTIDNSNSGNLQPSSQVAFIAQMDIQPTTSLYWRGRVHSYTDGYNWKSSSLVTRTSQTKRTYNQNDLIKYNIKYEQDFDSDIILLDVPIAIEDSNLRIYKDKEFHTFKTYAKKKKAYITATSVKSLKQLSYEPKNTQDYIKLPGLITKAINPIIDSLKKEKDIQQILLGFKKYLNDNNFSYTLSPKNASTLKNFIQNKEGFCTHYASLLGVVLRKLKYPTRLVSGFQGGIYNDIGRYYKVSSNDAHAWVEVYVGNSWMRVDPTSFIAPDRVLRGGEAFFTGEVIDKNTKNRNFLSPYYYSAKQYWDNLNYKVSLFFDTYDRDKQRNLSETLKIKRYIFIILGLILFVLMIFVFYYMSFTKNNSARPVDQNFNLFKRKLEKKKVYILPTDNIQDVKMKIKNSNINNKRNYYIYLDQYQLSKYSPNSDINNLKRLLRIIK